MKRVVFPTALRFWSLFFVVCITFSALSQEDSPAKPPQKDYSGGFAAIKAMGLPDLANAKYGKLELSQFPYSFLQQTEELFSLARMGVDRYRSGNAWLLEKREDGSRLFMLRCGMLIEIQPESDVLEDDTAIHAEFEAVRIERDIKSLLKELNEDNDMISYIDPADIFPAVLLFAAQLHDAGHPEKANEIAHRVFTLAPTQKHQEIMESLISGLVDAKNFEVMLQWAKTKDFVSYRDGLNVLIKKYGTGWKQVEFAKAMVEALAEPLPEEAAETKVAGNEEEVAVVAQNLLASLRNLDELEELGIWLLLPPPRRRGVLPSYILDFIALRKDALPVLRKWCKDHTFTKAVCNNSLRGGAGFAHFPAEFRSQLSSSGEFHQILQRMGAGGDGLEAIALMGGDDAIPAFFLLTPRPATRHDIAVALLQPQMFTPLTAPETSEEQSPDPMITWLQWVESHDFREFAWEYLLNNSNSDDDFVRNSTAQVAFQYLLTVELTDKEWLQLENMVLDSAARGIWYGEDVARLFVGAYDGDRQAFIDRFKSAVPIEDEDDQERLDDVVNELREMGGVTSEKEETELLSLPQIIEMATKGEREWFQKQDLVWRSLAQSGKSDEALLRILLEAARENNSDQLTYLAFAVPQANKVVKEIHRHRRDSAQIMTWEMLLKEKSGNKSDEQNATEDNDEETEALYRSVVANAGIIREYLPERTEETYKEESFEYKLCRILSWLANDMAKGEIYEGMQEILQNDDQAQQLLCNHVIDVANALLDGVDPVDFPRLPRAANLSEEQRVQLVAELKKQPKEEIGAYVSGLTTEEILALSREIESQSELVLHMKDYHLTIGKVDFSGVDGVGVNDGLSAKLEAFKGRKLTSTIIDDMVEVVEDIVADGGGVAVGLYSGKGLMPARIEVRNLEEHLEQWRQFIEWRGEDIEDRLKEQRGAGARFAVLQVDEENDEGAVALWGDTQEDLVAWEERGMPPLHPFEMMFYRQYEKVEPKQVYDQVALWEKQMSDPEQPITHFFFLATGMSEELADKYIDEVVAEINEDKGNKE